MLRGDGTPFELQRHDLPAAHDHFGHVADDQSGKRLRGQDKHGPFVAAFDVFAVSTTFRREIRHGKSRLDLDCYPLDTVLPGTRLAQ